MQSHPSPTRPTGTAAGDLQALFAAGSPCTPSAIKRAQRARQSGESPESGTNPWWSNPLSRSGRLLPGQTPQGGPHSQAVQSPAAATHPASSPLTQPPPAGPTFSEPTQVGACSGQHGLPSPLRPHSHGASSNTHQVGAHSAHPAQGSPTRGRWVSGGAWESGRQVSQGLQACRPVAVMPGRVAGPDRPLVGLGSPVRMAEASHAFLAAWQSPCRGQAPSAARPASPSAGHAPPPHSAHAPPHAADSRTVQGNAMHHHMARSPDQTPSTARFAPRPEAMPTIGESQDRAKECSWVQPGMEREAARAGCSDAELSRRPPGGMSLVSQSTPELPKFPQSHAAMRYADPPVEFPAAESPAYVVSGLPHVNATDLSSHQAMPISHAHPRAAKPHGGRVDQPEGQGRTTQTQPSLKHVTATPMARSNMQGNGQEQNDNGSAEADQDSHPIPAAQNGHDDWQRELENRPGEVRTPRMARPHPAFRMSVPPATPASISPILERAAGRLTPGSAKALERMRLLHLQRKSGMGLIHGPTPRRDVASALEAAAGKSNGVDDKPSRYLNPMSRLGQPALQTNHQGGDVIADEAGASARQDAGDCNNDSCSRQAACAEPDHPESRAATHLHQDLPKDSYVIHAAGPRTLNEPALGADEGSQPHKRVSSADQSTDPADARPTPVTCTVSMSGTQSGLSQKREPDPAGVSTPQKQKRVRAGRSPHVVLQTTADQGGHAKQDQENIPGNISPSGSGRATGRPTRSRKSGRSGQAKPVVPGDACASTSTGSAPMFAPETAATASLEHRTNEQQFMLSETDDGHSPGRLEADVARDEGPDHEEHVPTQPAGKIGSPPADPLAERVCNQGTAPTEAGSEPIAADAAGNGSESQRPIGTLALWHSILIRQGLSFPEGNENSPMVHRPLAAGLLHGQVRACICWTNIRRDGPIPVPGLIITAACLQEAHQKV